MLLTTNDLKLLLPQRFFQEFWNLVEQQKTFERKKEIKGNKQKLLSLVQVGRRRSRERGEKRFSHGNWNPIEYASGKLTLRGWKYHTCVCLRGGWVSVGACMGVCVSFKENQSIRNSWGKCVCACMSVCAFKGVDENAMRERKKDKSILEWENGNKKERMRK